MVGDYRFVVSILASEHMEEILCSCFILVHGNVRHGKVDPELEREWSSLFVLIN